MIPTLSTIPYECVLEILKHVSLPECISLRSTCSHVKTAVDEHIRTQVRSLSVLLTAPHSAGSVARLEQPPSYLAAELPTLLDLEVMTFGSTSVLPQCTMWEEKQIFNTLPVEQQRSLRREHFLIVPNMAKFISFVMFVGKYLPGITKLALLVDHDDQLRNVPTVLGVYRKQLKVLLLEKTVRSGLQFDDNDTEQPQKVNFKKHVFSAGLYSSIEGLDGLEELYFFPVPRNRYFLEWSTVANRDLVKQEFLLNMLRKLRVVHFNDCGHFSWDVGFDEEYFARETFENLEEIACQSSNMFTWLIARFPRLEKCIVFKGGNEKHLLDNPLMPNLKHCLMDYKHYHSGRSIEIEKFWRPETNSFLQCATSVLPDRCMIGFESNGVSEIQVKN